MPTIVRKSNSTFLQTRREIPYAVNWQVRSHFWNPPTDQYEIENAFVVRVEIAGMREEDFEILIENSALFISGSRPDFREQRAYQQMEIRFGRFEIAVSLPGPINIELASAEYKDGFLTVILPKTNSETHEVE